MSQETQTHGEEQAASHEVHTGHPTPATYFKVAVTLTLITLLEVGVFYVTGLGYGIIPILVILSGVKFVLVAMFYMHLRYDAELFTRFFVGGLALAGAVVITLMALFRVLI